MPVKIRLMRIGAKKRPFYRIVAVDERKKRTGSYLENLGTYNPLTNPKEINLKQDRIDEWVKKGAVLSDGFLRIIGKAPKKTPRKPKKETQKSSSEQSSPTDENQKLNKEAPAQEQKEQPESRKSNSEQPESTTDKATKTEGEEKI